MLAAKPAANDLRFACRIGKAVPTKGTLKLARIPSAEMPELKPGKDHGNRLAVVQIGRLRHEQGGAINTQPGRRSSANHPL